MRAESFIKGARTRTFLGLLPPPSQRSAMRRAAEEITRGPGTETWLYGEPWLHVSLAGLLEGAGDEAVAALGDAADAVAYRPFDVAFDHIISWRNNCLVAAGTDNVVGLIELHERIATALAKQGFRGPTRFTPHVTLAKSPIDFGDTDIRPVRWTVTEFVLLHRWPRARRYAVLGRWPLGGPRRGALI
ncbi:2'-5' RNA ligase family protein [Caulobacter mirabilis]|uniref:RNA 2',3'-cyclic phosphodiesterase n=1 Tax=Caulobacter mirabilis TaxID=69666 RepID=A0A2D2AXB7_9CAUL|nr:2'-5' RNA ligase family protein [Caulobacter mirabilis]ATQ42646.1 hypothetical protein CSW64_09610 [Caulobacter mirabilis]